MSNHISLIVLDFGWKSDIFLGQILGGEMLFHSKNNGDTYFYNHYV